MSGALYYPIFIYTVAAMAAIVGIRYLNSPGYMLQEKGNRDFVLPLIVSLVYAFWLGHRPIFGGYFGDTGNYAIEYINMIPREVKMDWHGEWIWQWLMVTCKAAGLSVSSFFTIVELGYFISVLYAIKKFMPQNVFLGMLFVMSSLMFFTFGVNGLRNGLACHLVTLGIAFLFSSNYLGCAICYVIAFGIHRSTLLPIASSIVAVFIQKDVKYALYFWIASIPISLFFGGTVTAFFAGLGFDDRMQSYTTDQDMSVFSRTGFRWDFLMYSMVPVAMTWVVCIKKQISDNWYNAICSIYCYCNAFWIMVIRSSYSNRFAYLSWFIYPIVVAYPLIMLPVWEDQDIKTALILFAYVSFTIIMSYLWHTL